MYSFPRHVAMLLEVPGYWEKDDHDTLYNEGWRGQKEAEVMLPMTFEDGLRTFREQVPMGERTYRTFRGESVSADLARRRAGLPLVRGNARRADKTIWGKSRKRSGCSSRCWRATRTGRSS